MPNDANQPVDVKRPEIIPADSTSFVLYKKLKPMINVDIVSGFGSGAVCAGLFNPWDRALFLAFKHNRSFLLRDNFTHPYHGLSQAMVCRIVSGGAYPFFQTLAHKKLKPILLNELQLPEFATTLAVGLTAGAAYGSVTNVMSAIKSEMWAKPGSSFFSSTAYMLKQDGVKPFMKGMPFTVARDAKFGLVFEGLNGMISQHVIKGSDVQFYRDHPEVTGFLSKATSAGVATLFSSPFNYIRVKKQATPASEKTPTTKQVMRYLLWDQVTGNRRPVSHILNSLRIGPGTARVALAMPVGLKVYEVFQEALMSPDELQSKKMLKK